jgi:hypothetical protein
LKYATTGNQKFLTTTLSTLAPISGLSSIYANSFNALTSMTCSSLRVNNNAEVLGDVLYGLGPTSLTSTMNAKAPLASPSFTGTLTTAGDIRFNGTSSLTTIASTVSTINSYKTSGSISGTSTYQTIYTVVQGTRGFITVIAIAPHYNMFLGFFEWTAGGSYQSLTQIAQSGNAPQSVLSTTNASSGGTMSLTVQQVSNTGPIQAKVSTAGIINWYITLI